MRDKNFLSDLLSRRTSFVEVLLTALFLALGINLISSSLPPLLSLSNQATLTIGLMFCVVSIVYFLFRLFGERHRVQNYSGFLSYNRRNGEIISVRDYYFSRIIKMYIDFALSEIRTLKKDWDDQSLDNVLVDDDRESIKIIREATEYFILKELSLHLQEYFKGSQDIYVKSFYRNDIRSVTEKNRFLKLFTAPRIDIPDEKGDLQSDFPEITRSHNQRSNFVLILPKESRIKRIDERKIEIDTSKFKITIEAIFFGVNYEITTGFHRYYLNLNRNDKVTDFTVGVKIDVLFKLQTFVSSTGLNYYRWLDSFLEKLDKIVSEKVFFDTIQWKAAYPVIEHINTITTASSSHPLHNQSESSSE